MFSQQLQIQFKSSCMAKRTSNEWHAQEYHAEDLFITRLSQRITSIDIHWSKIVWLSQCLWLCVVYDSWRSRWTFQFAFPHWLSMEMRLMWYYWLHCDTGVPKPIWWSQWLISTQFGRELVRDQVTKIIVPLQIFWTYRVRKSLGFAYFKNT